MINIITSSRYVIDRKIIKEAIHDFLILKQASSYVINIAFVGKTKMKAVTQTYKHENEILPVLSFPFHKEKSEDGEILGEVIICYPLAILLAAERSKRVDDMLIFLIKHGIENLLK